MGNHEYCELCGESDYHYHRNCDPDKLAARQKEKREADSRREIQVSRLKQALDSLGVEYRIDEHGNAKIDNHQYSDHLIAWREERNAVKTLCAKVWWCEVGYDDIIEVACQREKGHDGNCKSQSGTSLNNFYKERV